MGSHFGPHTTQSSWSRFRLFVPEIIFLVMTGIFKTITLIQEAELDRLHQRQIKDYNNALKSLTKSRTESLKFYDSELSDEGKCKILAQLQDRFGLLLKKFQNAGLPPAHVLPHQPALPFPAPNEHVGDGQPPAVVEEDSEDFFLPGKALTQKKEMLPLTLSHQHGP